jgi:hypothetical protein
MGICQPDPLLNDHLRERERERAVFMGMWSAKKLSPCSSELFSQISNHLAVFFSHNKPANSTFSHNKPAKRTGCVLLGLRCVRCWKICRLERAACLLVKYVECCKVLIRKSSMIEGVIGLSNKLDVIEFA